MLFAVVREIEQQRRDCRVFPLRHDARVYFEAARYVCDNEPLEPPDGDGAIVTNCWLYLCETADPLTAERLAMSGAGHMLQTCYDPSD
jgi:hypothetical protein